MIKSKIKYLEWLKNDSAFLTEVLSELNFSKLDNIVKINNRVDDTDFIISLVKDTQVDKNDTHRINTYLNEDFLGYVTLSLDEFENGLSDSANTSFAEFLVEQISKSIFNTWYFSLDSINDMYNTCDIGILKRQVNDILEKTGYQCEIVISEKFFIFELLQLEPFELKSTFNFTDVDGVGDFSMNKLFIYDLVYRHLTKEFKRNINIVNRYD